MADTTPTTSYDAFKLVMSQYFDNIDAEAGWIGDLYNAAQNYIAQGQDMADVPQLLLDDKNAPESFKSRFAGIYEMRKRRAAGESISYIPNVAEYSRMKTELSNTLKKYNLNDITNDATLNKILGTGTDLQETEDRINTAFAAVDNADEYLKKELATNFPNLNRSDLAMAMMLGPDGAKALQKKIDIAGIKASASEFGVNAQANAENAVNMGVTRGQVRQAYEKTSLELGGIQQAAQMFGDQTGDLAKQVEESNLYQKQNRKVEGLKSQARAQFAGQTGVVTGTLRKKPSGQI